MQQPNFIMTPYWETLCLRPSPGQIISDNTGNMSAACMMANRPYVNINEAMLVHNNTAIAAFENINLAHLQMQPIPVSLHMPAMTMPITPVQMQIPAIPVPAASAMSVPVSQQQQSLPLPSLKDKRRYTSSSRKTTQRPLVGNSLQLIPEVSSLVQSANAADAQPLSGDSSTTAKSARRRNRKKEVPRHPCPMCNKVMSTPAEVKVHLRVHTGERPYHCPDCEKAFKKSSHLLYHRRTHTGEKLHQCPECKKCLTTAYHLSEHMRIHSGVKPYTCDVCNKSFQSKAYAAIHRRTHTGEKPYICMICDKSFAQLSTLRTHLRIHRREHYEKHDFACVVCGTTFAFEVELKHHSETHQSAANTPDKRGVHQPSSVVNNNNNISTQTQRLTNALSSCNSSTTDGTVNTISNSYETATNIVQSTFVSDVAISTTDNTYSCPQQQLYTTPPQPLFELNNAEIVSATDNNCIGVASQHCENRTCDFGSTQSFSMPVFKTPLATASSVARECNHSNGSRVVNRRYSCPVCSKPLSGGPAEVKRHLRVHTNERPYTCPHCDKAFKKSSHLLYHKRTHTGERPHACTQCGKSFTKRNHLVEHQRTHSGDRPFYCDVCNKTFHSKSYVLVHRRTHTGERPYRCPSCDKSFIQASGLRVHSLVHTRATTERKFSCPVCQKLFYRPFEVKSHMRRHRHAGELPSTLQSTNAPS